MWRSDPEEITPLDLHIPLFFNLIYDNVENPKLQRNGKWKWRGNKSEDDESKKWRTYFIGLWVYTFINVFMASKLLPNKKKS